MLQSYASSISKPEARNGDQISKSKTFNARLSVEQLFFSAIFMLAYDINIFSESNVVILVT